MAAGSSAIGSESRSTSLAVGSKLRDSPSADESSSSGSRKRFMPCNLGVLCLQEPSSLTDIVKNQMLLAVGCSLLLSHRDGPVGCLSGERGGGCMIVDERGRSEERRVGKGGS